MPPRFSFKRLQGYLNISIIQQKFIETPDYGSAAALTTV
jgi:hypothetical protein